MKKILTITTISLLSLLIGVFIEKQIQKSEDNKIVEINKLNRGIYALVYPDKEFYMIQIVIEDETKEFVVYEEAVEINKGTYKFTGNNTFEFTGDKFNFDLYYTKNLYITSFKNRLNQKHLEFEYASSATVHYG